MSFETYTVRVPTTLNREFSMFCELAGKDKSEFILDFIEKFVKTHKAKFIQDQKNPDAKITK